MPTRKNPRLNVFEGDDLRKADGKWMHKTRVIDKTRDLYIERVVDRETGVIVRECKERLSAHTGRGSAKTKDTDATSHG